MMLMQLLPISYNGITTVSYTVHLGSIPGIGSKDLLDAVNVTGGRRWNVSDYLPDSLSGKASVL